MTDLAEYLLPKPPPDQGSWRWATVTAVSPLRVRLDGDTAPLDLTPDALGPVRTGDRVWCQIVGRRVVVHPRSSTSGAYTPVITGVSAAATGWWERIGDTVHVSIDVVLSGPLTSFGVSVPVASAYTARHHGVGLAYLVDASGGGSSGRRIWTAYLVGSTIAVQDGTTGQVLSATVPWTWASGDTIAITATYQAA